MPIFLYFFPDFFIKTKDIALLGTLLYIRNIKSVPFHEILMYVAVSLFFIYCLRQAGADKKSYARAWA